MEALIEIPDIKERVAQATVTSLHYYPIKSCAGIEVTAAEVGDKGFLHDRELLLVTPEDGMFLTQRDLPRMALIRPFIKNGILQVEAPGMPPLDMFLQDEGTQLTTTVWKSTIESIDQGREAARWFSEFLGVDCRLVKMSSGFTRSVNPSYAVSESDQVGYADGFPFLLISDESLEDLNSRMAEPLPMNRFRPNIVIKGSGVPFIEDRIRQIKIGEIVFSIVKPCARCKITTTNQQTAEVGKEPLKTLATFRKVVRRGVMFGQNLIHESRGTLQVGDKVELLRLKK
jgi:uncharacterized protein YcbX